MFLLCSLLQKLPACSCPPCAVGPNECQVLQVVAQCPLHETAQPASPGPEFGTCLRLNLWPSLHRTQPDCEHLVCEAALTLQCLLLPGAPCCGAPHVSLGERAVAEEPGVYGPHSLADPRPLRCHLRAELRVGVWNVLG